MPYPRAVLSVVPRLLNWYEGSLFGGIRLSDHGAAAAIRRLQLKGMGWAGAAALGGAFFILPWKVATSHGSTQTMVLLMLVAAALMNTVVWQLASPASRRRPRRLEMVFALALAVITLLGNLASAEAVLRLSPATVSALLRGEVLMVAVLGWFVLGERVNLMFWAGAAAALTGIWWMQPPDGPGVAAGDGAGILLSIAAALCFALMSVFTRRFINRIDIFLVNSLRLWFAVGLWFVFHGSPPAVQELNGTLIICTVLAAALGPGFSRVAMMFSARYVEARITSLTLQLGPVLTLLLAFLILGDLPTFRELSGSVLLLAGVSLPLLVQGRPVLPVPRPDVSN